VGDDRANGWIGGRDRDKPRQRIWRLRVRGECVGGVSSPSDGAPYTAWHILDAEDVSRTFTRLRDAKRWVEAESARRRGDAR
jgi:hypothetical protein